MDIIKMQLDYCKISDYHKRGFLGDGITILNHESETYHAKCTKEILQLIAPKATIIDSSVGVLIRNGVVQYYTFTIDGVKYTPSEMYEKFKPNIMSVSFAGSPTDRILEEYIKPLQKKGLIVVNASGNDGSKGVSAKYKEIDITVGSVVFTINNYYKEPVVAGYSSYDIDELNVDFMGFTGNYSGTSFACPWVAGQIALIMSRFGKMNQTEIHKVLIDCAKDVYKLGVDDKSGHGVIIMPEKVEVNRMVEFTDIVGHWAEDTIKNSKAIELKIMQGYPDKTFKPDQMVSRAELLVVIDRILNIINK